LPSAYWVPQVVQMKLDMAHHPLGNPLARSSSADAQRRFSISAWLFTVSSLIDFEEKASSHLRCWGWRQQGGYLAVSAPFAPFRPARLGLPRAGAMNASQPTPRARQRVFTVSQDGDRTSVSKRAISERERPLVSARACCVIFSLPEFPEVVDEAHAYFANPARRQSAASKDTWWGDAVVAGRVIGSRQPRRLHQNATFAPHFTATSSRPESRSRSSGSRGCCRRGSLSGRCSDSWPSSRSAARGVRRESH